MATTFTVNYIESLKPADGINDVREGKGFGLRVLPSGIKTWFFIYRVDGKRRFMNLGHYPSISLAEARKKYRAAYDLYEQGKDPAVIAETDKDDRRKSPTVAKLVAEYMEKHAKPNKKTWKRDELCLNNDVIPVMGKLKAQDVRKRDVVLLLEGIVERGAPGQARTVLEVVRRMFAFAVERDILETSPMFGVKPLTKKVAKDRVLAADEVKVFWEGLDKAGVSDEIKRALKLVLVTGARPGEVLGMHSSEIDGNWWQIPAERSKNGIVHRVFITKTAKDLIGGGEGYIFESPRDVVLPSGEVVSKPMAVNALAYALRRNLKDYKRQRAARKVSDSDSPVMVPVPEEKKLDLAPFTPHDLRRTAATMLAAIGYTNEIIDAILGHKARGVVAVYNRHDYAKEKQEAMQALERKLTSIITSKQGATVTPISAGRNRGSKAA
jgi:integrase